MTFEFVRTALGDDPIIVEGYFAAPPARLFAAWTDPDIVVKWFGKEPYSLHSATIDLRPGGAWKFLKSVDENKTIGFEGEYITIEPDRLLVFSWAYVVVHANGVREATLASRVEVTFTARGSGTDVCLVHSAIEDDAMRRGFAGGWDRAFATMKTLFNEATAPA